MYAKYYENPTMFSRVTAKNVGDAFLRHSVFSKEYARTLTYFILAYVSCVDVSFTLYYYNIILLLYYYKIVYLLIHTGNDVTLTLLPNVRQLNSINQSISMNLLWRPTSKALGRQKYSENTTA